MDHQSIREKNDRRLGWASAIMGIIFGSLIAFVGMAIFRKDNFGIRNLQKIMVDRDVLLMQIFGGVCIVYGLWRILRAITKIKNG